ncbi:MAG: hypothetical protein ACE14L_00475 [Terriglobales bacterium]
MSTQETLMIVFIAVTSVAVVIQMGVMVALYAAVKKSSARMEAVASQLQTRALPTLDMAQGMLQDYRPKVDTILANVEETSTIVRQQAKNIDIQLGELLDRSRMHLARVDEIMTRTLDRVEGATDLVHQSMMSPIRQATGVLQGVTTGLATLFGRGPYARAKRGAGTPREDLFI